MLVLDKVISYYVDEGNLTVIEDAKNLKITTDPFRG